jgi:hypothetical protein
MKIFLVFFLVLIVWAVPEEDVVHLKPVDYNHTWYSGIFFIYTF